MKTNKPNSDNGITALLVVDPYNDFISDGGKIWPRIKAVAEANNCVPNMLQVLNVARKAKVRIFFAMHHRYRPGDYETWKYIAPIQKAAWARKTFEYGSWGGEFRAEFAPEPGEIVVQEHWCVNRRGVPAPIGLAKALKILKLEGSKLGAYPHWTTIGFRHGWPAKTSKSNEPSRIK